MINIKISAAAARLQTRISTELQGRTMTDFVVAVIQQAAHQAIQPSSVIQLSVRDQELLAQALLGPARPALALERAFKRRREFVHAE